MLQLFEKQNKSSNGGVNPTNIERQNEKVQGKNQMDNKQNFVNGKSQDITQ